MVDSEDRIARYRHNCYNVTMATRLDRNMGVGDRLAKFLKRLTTRLMLPAHVSQFKAFQYNGQRNIEYFITYFEEITEANEWGHEATLLHFWELRSSSCASSILLS